MKNKILQITLGRDYENIICISIVRVKSNGDAFGRVYHPELETLTFAENVFNSMLDANMLKVTHVSTSTSRFGMAVTYAPVKPQESFEIMSVLREDLDRLGFDTSAVDDSTMYKIANKLSENWISNDDLYDGLEYLGTKFEIPRPNPKSIYDDEE